MISTRTSANGCLNARRTFSPAGRYRRPAAISARRKSPMAAMRSATGASADAHPASTTRFRRSEEHTSELQSQSNFVCRLLLEKKTDHKHTDPNLNSEYPDQTPSCLSPFNSISLSVRPHEYIYLVSIAAALHDRRDKSAHTLAR